MSFCTFLHFKHSILSLQGEVNANSLPLEDLSIQHPQVRADSVAVMCVDSVALMLLAVRRLVSGLAGHDPGGRLALREPIKRNISNKKSEREGLLQQHVQSFHPES